MDTQLKIKEVFYTLQGEGAHAGMPAVFVRLGDCNLRCTFCDTDFLTDLKDFSVKDLAKRIRKEAGPCRNIVFTGGEPLLQQNGLTELMTELGSSWYYCVETNGTMHMTPFFRHLISWVCVSPKVKPSDIQIQQASEIKVVFTKTYRKWMKEFRERFLATTYWYVSPEAASENNYADNKVTVPEGKAYPEGTNYNEVINFCKENPEWRLNLQSHKVLNIR